MNRKSIALCAAVLFAVLQGQSILAADEWAAMRVKYDEQLEAIDAQFAENTTQVLKQYAKDLDSLANKTQRRGDLDGLMAIRSEADRFLAERTLTATNVFQKPGPLRDTQTSCLQALDAMPKRRAQSILAMWGRYDGALSAMEKKLTVQNSVDAAIRVREERERVRKSAEVTSAQFIVEETDSRNPKPETPEQARNPQVTTKPQKLVSDVLRHGLFLYYPFDKDEGNRVTDASGNGHDGRPQGSRWTPDGKVGGAFAFGGSDYVEMGYQPAGTEITLAAWIKPANTGLGFFLGTHFSESSLWMLTVEGPHGPPKQCARIGYNTGTDGESLFGTSNVQDGRWHHVAATIDSKGAKLYVDGVLENQNAVPGNWKGANAAIGRSLTGSPGFYSGLVDEVMIFHRPLTAAEIKQIYDAQKRGR